jgi:ATP-dependent DNA helicase RecG
MAWLADLKCLEAPLRFASRNNFESLHKVRGLEHTLHEAAKRLIQHPAPAWASELLQRFITTVPPDNAPSSTRIEQLQKCLKLLEQLQSPPAHQEPAQKGLPPVQTGAVDVSFTLEDPVRFVPGVGPKLEHLLAARGVHCVRDALLMLPKRYEDRVGVQALGDIKEGDVVSSYVKVKSASVRIRNKRSMFEVVVSDPTGHLTLVWFKHAGKGFTDMFKPGVALRVAGLVKRFGARLHITHPEISFKPQEASSQEKEPVQDAVVPFYGEFEGIPAAKIRTFMRALLPLAHHLKETLPPSLLQQHRLPSWGEAVACLHAPPQHTPVDILHNHQTRWHHRLIYEELLLLQWAVHTHKNTLQRDAGCAIPKGIHIAACAHTCLPFTPTGAQLRVLEEIGQDMAKPHPMHRLVQGDVGCGKTAVALVACAVAGQAGYQSAVMAPTEILAKQHAASGARLLQPIGLRTALLTSSMPTSERKKVLQQLASGEVHTVFGTHALIQDTVSFKALALAVIDEQHRFGVAQRAALTRIGHASLGLAPHVLNMTATPIPRTLALTAYGDLDVSVIDELPPGRTPIKTYLYREAQRMQAYARVVQAVSAGRQAYVVFPLVESSDKEGMEQLRDVTSAAEELGATVLASCKVGWVHGRMDAAEKDHVMQAFAQGRLDVLMATTVIEVGVDVPNATVMVIEHAERFGLSQLHQLRGRVGRGAHQSMCLLLASQKTSQDSWQRLCVMEHSQDGFYIAEQDLDMRGPGDFLGTRQSGLPQLTFAHLVRDQAWLLKARQDVLTLLHEDPHLTHPEHAGLKHLVQKNLSFNHKPTL